MYLLRHLLDVQGFLRKILLDKTDRLADVFPGIPADILKVGLLGPDLLRTAITVICIPFQYFTHPLLLPADIPGRSHGCAEFVIIQRL